MLNFLKGIFHDPHSHSNDELVEYVSNETGWTYEEAKAAMDRAKADGFSYKYYVKRKIWARSEAEYEQAKKDIRIVNERNEKERKQYIELVSRATGWTETRVKAEFQIARKNCGCSYKDYYKFKLYDKSPDIQREFLTLEISEKLAQKYNKDPEKLKILRRKDLFAKEFSDLFNRKWFLNRNLSFDEFVEKTRDVDSLICKPIAATQGKGVKKIYCSDDISEQKSIYEDLISDRKKLICEECIIQHPEIAAFNPTSVNTIRVLTIVDKGACHHIYAGFRMGRGKIVDNFHAGGIIATIDVKTGITCTDAVDLDGKHYSFHPISELPISDFQIPHWDRVLKVTEEAALRLEGVELVGWDIAVTETGICLIEGNSQASYAIIQLPYADAGIGMRSTFQQFLEN